MTTQTLRLSLHAAGRMRQRGIPMRLIDMLIENADRSLFAGADTETVRLSAGAAEELLADGASPDDVSRARRLAAVVSSRLIVTVLRHETGRKGRLFRRQMRTHSATR